MGNILDGRADIGLTYSRQDFTGFLDSILPDQPPGTVGNAQHQYEKYQGREKLDTKHPSPGIFANRGKQVIGKKRHHNSKNHIELEQGYQSASHMGRRYFRYIHGANN